MALQKWYKKGLLEMDKQGYKIVPCKSEKEAIKVKDIYKQNKRCSQAGYILNKHNEPVYFVLTKFRTKNV